VSISVSDRLSSNDSSNLGECSSSLLVRLRAFDQNAWDRFVSLYGPLVYVWCRNAGLQAADAADVGQEVFRAVAQKINDFRRSGPNDSFHGWVRKIVRNKIVDHFRRRSKQAHAAGGTDALNDLLAIPAASDPLIDGDVSNTDAARSANDHIELRMLVHQAVELIRSSFEERTCRAFWKIAVDGRLPKDVAAELKMSLSAVYMAKSRVLRRLREEFGEIIDFRSARNS
jgi:RNA polymerase sigma-70 factor, ECF subfamily